MRYRMGMEFGLEGWGVLEPLADLARRCKTLDTFVAALDRSVEGQVYRPRGLREAMAMRREGGSLAGYSRDAQEEWFGRYADPRHRTAVPTDGRITLYRASRAGGPILPGEYVTESRAYALDHMRDNLGDEGRIVTIEATLDDIFPADGPHEFWYAPAALDAFESVQDLYERAHGRE